MTDFDKAMKDLLSEADEDFIGDAIDETGFYKSAWGSLSGKGSGMRVMAWGAIMVFAAIMIISLWQMFMADNIRSQILWATFAILGNSAQIAMKLWFNMQLNRRALSHEIRRLHLAVMAKS